MARRNARLLLPHLAAAAVALALAAGSATAQAPEILSPLGPWHAGAAAYFGGAPVRRRPA
jgi:hypothetical protein